MLTRKDLNISTEGPEVELEFEEEELGLLGPPAEGGGLSVSMLLLLEGGLRVEAEEG